MQKFKTNCTAAKFGSCLQFRPFQRFWRFHYGIVEYILNGSKSTKLNELKKILWLQKNKFLCLLGTNTVII